MSFNFEKILNDIKEKFDRFSNVKVKNIDESGVNDNIKTLNINEIDKDVDEEIKNMINNETGIDRIKKFYENSK